MESDSDGPRCVSVDSSCPGSSSKRTYEASVSATPDTQKKTRLTRSNVPVTPGTADHRWHEGQRVWVKVDGEGWVKAKFSVSVTMSL